MTSPPTTPHPRRLKALALTAPLHDLDSRKPLMRDGTWNDYQMAELGLHAIDTIAMSMDLLQGADPDTVTTTVAAAAATQCPDRDTNEHHDVADWVLASLVNAGTADRGFSVVYGHTSNGEYHRKQWPFRLITEELGADTRPYWRATNEAINVLIGALDSDVESAQIAAESRLALLIERGHVADAVTAATEARLRSIQYSEMLRRKLDATTRNVRNVDWLTEMPKFLDTALAHIRTRYEQEHQILVAVDDLVDNADTTNRADAATLVVEVKRCLSRHGQLQKMLLDAGPTFRRAQDSQTFTDTVSVTNMDLTGQLLTPTLALPVDKAHDPLTTFVARSAGVHPAPLLRLADLFEQLTTPTAGPSLLADAIEEPDLVEHTNEETFTAETVEALATIWPTPPADVDTPATPVRLSQLLRHARKHDGHTDQLATLTVIRAVTAATRATARHSSIPTLNVTADNTELADETFGGQDLLFTFTPPGTTQNIESGNE